MKTRLFNEWRQKFSEVKARKSDQEYNAQGWAAGLKLLSSCLADCSLFLSDTTRPPKDEEEHHSFYFVSEDEMRKDIVSHKFIEFGKHQQHLYGVKADSILDVVNSGKMCILDVHPQVC